ncbi:hypothetical protein [Agromyces sp. H66]|uniref:hypothetical protein n=1 Tax=Agromyces sp. H66 TaxID=2529859 RepID=UPI00145AE366|nr:hypothetical protein [Agromyces sp. H66]
MSTTSTPSAVAAPTRVPSPAVVRWTAAAFAAAGVLWALFPLLRPWADKATVSSDELATAWASDAWVFSHLAGITALGLLAPALLGLRRLVADTSDTRGATLLTWATALAWIGAAGASLYYGAEIFGVRTLAEASLRRGDATFLEEVQALREQPVAVVLFGVGLLLVAAAGVLTAIALIRARVPWAWTGVVLAVGLVLVLPQFFTPPAIRIVHGVIFGLGYLLVAFAVTRLGARSR